MFLKNSRQGSASKKNDRSTSAKGKGSKGSAKSSRLGSAKSAKSSKSKKTEEPKEVENIPKPGDKGINIFRSFEKFLIHLQRRCLQACEILALNFPIKNDIISDYNWLTNDKAKTIRNCSQLFLNINYVII